MEKISFKNEFSLKIYEHFNFKGFFENFPIFLLLHFLIFFYSNRFFKIFFMIYKSKKLLFNYV